MENAQYQPRRHYSSEKPLNEIFRIRIWNGPSCEQGELQVVFISYLLMIEDN
jgi:hypothetical protein